MLKSLSRTERNRRLRSPGLAVRIGPFVFSLRCSLPDFSDPIGYLYAFHELVDPCEFADFHITMTPRPWLRGFITSEATIKNDEMVLFERFRRHHGLAYWEWGLNRCVVLHCNHYLILHAAVVERGGKALVLAGEPGSGKSTLCAALALSGWRLLSDELGMLSPSDGELTSLVRPITLKNESIHVIQRLRPHAEFGPLVPGTLKGTVRHIRPNIDAVSRVNEKAKPSWLVFVKYEQGSGMRVDAVRKAQAMMRIARSAFNYGILGLKGFKVLAGAIEESETLSLRYDNIQEAIDFFNRPPFPPVTV
jgi:HprK-related kinase A